MYISDAGVQKCNSKIKKHWLNNTYLHDKLTKLQNKGRKIN